MTLKTGVTTKEISDLHHWIKLVYFPFWYFTAASDTRRVLQGTEQILQTDSQTDSRMGIAHCPEKSIRRV